MQWLARALPTKMRSASRRAIASASSVPRRSCTMTSASPSRRSARKVSRSPAPGPAPTRCTMPRGARSAFASASSIARSASASRPAAASAAGGPSSALSRKRRRAPSSGSRLRTAAFQRSAMAAMRPRPGGSAASIFCRTSRASTGAAPPDETATVTGARSMIAGISAVQSAGRSTTFTGMPRARQDSDRACRSASEASAPIAIAMPSSSAGAKAVACRISAPASRSSAAFRSAASPAPSTSATRPRRSRNTGKCCITRVPVRAPASARSAPTAPGGRSRSRCRRASPRRSHPGFWHRRRCSCKSRLR